ncbi:MAG: NUDIX domain-containing protein [bacterium]|nr:NUDIX domain-containing protein [bacterium]
MPFSELENYFEEKKQLFRKGVSALIMNKKKEFLLVNLEAFTNHFFAIPGGGLEENESTEDAVYREIQEELGITRQSLELVGVCEESIKLVFKTKKLQRDGIEYDGSERYFFGFKFIGNDSEIKLQEGEIRSYKWGSYGKLKNYLLFDDQLKDTQEKILELFPSVKEII